MKTSDLLIAANTVWVVVAAVLVMFMQAGFAFLEAGLTRMKNAAHLADHRVVAERLGEVVGWAALSAASARRCYAGVAENSVYVAREARGLGIGHRLLEALIATAEAAGIWTIQTSVFPENRASLALHERCGFRVVGRRERIARRDGIWRDTVFLELRL